MRRSSSSVPLSFLISLDRASSHSWRGGSAQTSIMHEVDFVAPNDQIEGREAERGRERRTVTLLLPESRARRGI